MQVFILAAGDGERWGNHLGVSKQLIKFANITLLDRIQKQVIKYKPSSIHIVTRTLSCMPQRPEDIRLDTTGYIAQTIALTSHSWGGHNIFLLGDVFYSQDAIRKIFEYSGDFTFFGRSSGSSLVNCGHGELFGMVLKSNRIIFFNELLLKTKEAFHKGYPGNLWNMHHICSGIQLGLRNIGSSNLIEIDDYTNDIDTPVDYERRKQLYKRIALSELTDLLKAR